MSDNDAYKKRLVDNILKTVSGLGSIAMVTVSVSFMDIRDTQKKHVLLQSILIESMEKMTIHQAEMDRQYNIHITKNLNNRHAIDLEIAKLKSKHGN